MSNKPEEKTIFRMPVGTGRTAVTVATTHEGKDVLLFGPSTPITKQLTEYRNLLGSPAHAQYKTVMYQESDGHSRKSNFMTDAASKEFQERRSVELDKHKATGENDKKLIAQEETKPEVKTEKQTEKPNLTQKENKK